MKKLNQDTPVAPDMRQRAEGVELTILKVAAAILGLSPDVLSQRASEQERREKKIQRNIAMAMTVTSAIALGASFVAFDRLYEGEIRRSTAMAGRAQQSFSEGQV